MPTTYPSTQCVNLVAGDRRTLAPHVVAGGVSQQPLNERLETLDTSSHLHEVHRLAEYVDVEVDHRRARHKRVGRPDQVALNGGARVRSRVEERPLEVSRELALVKVEGALQMLGLEQGAHRLLQRRGRLLQVRQVRPHERPDLVDLLVLPTARLQMWSVSKVYFVKSVQRQNITQYKRIHYRHGDSTIFFLRF